ncbi:MAG: sarcosine oxidase subunit gamma [Lysobacterales bacterium]|jgi:sarcosine oxidase subunit gamma
MTDQAHIRHGLESFLESQCALDDESDGNSQGLVVRVQSGIGHINLRVNPADSDLVRVVEEILEQELPQCPNTMSSGQYRIYWLGPDEWQILCQLDRCSGLVEKLRSATADRHVSINDISTGQVTLNFSGPAVRDVLAAGCTLDFHPEVFKSGSCAQSGLAKAAVLIGRLEGDFEFEVMVRRSFAEYLALWLQHSTKQFGVKFINN